ncbi:MAG: c-type cytochrome [Agarilytica sp.]
MKILIVFLLFTLALGACSKKEKVSSEALSEMSEGERIVQTACKVCHAQGINGAPIIGNKKMWGDRLPRGIDQLSANASQGFGLMPPKGGRTDLSDEKVRLAVEYMLEQVQ